MDMPRQKGFTVLETVLILVVVSIIGFSAWYVWDHNRIPTTNILTAADSGAAAPDKNGLQDNCTLGDSATKGSRLVAANGAFSLCIPDGWQLGRTAGDIMSGWTNFIALGLVYKEGVSPTVVQTGGKDGPFILTLGYSFPSSGADQATGYEVAGTIKAQNVTGTRYAKTQIESSSGEGLGQIPQGTKQVMYAFAMNGGAVTLAYNAFPDSPDQSALVEQVAKSISLAVPDKGVRVLTFTHLSNNLQAAVIAHEQQEGACIQNGQLADVKGNLVDPDVTYMASGYATFANAACERPAELYVKASSDWQFIAETKYGFNCSDLEKYKVPAILFGLEPQCVTAGGAFQSYR